MTATLTPDAAIRTESARPTDQPSRSPRGHRGSSPRQGAASGERSAVRADAEPAGLRIRPVPRCEPLSDAERSDPLPGDAHLLAPDLATGVRVRRGSGVVGGAGRTAPGRSAGLAGPRAQRGTGARGRVTAQAETMARLQAMAQVGVAAGAGTGGSVGAGTAAVGAGSDSSISAPTLLRAPETVMAVVTTALHAEPAAPTRARPVQPAPVVLVSGPSLELVSEDSPSPRADHDLRVTAKRLLGTCVEVLGGFRPVAQLRPYCAPERFDAIANRLLRPIGAGRGHGATRSSLVLARTAPGRPARQSPEDRFIVRRVQICDVMDGIAELAVVLARRNKVWAMSMRMERNRGRWLCMHMEVL